MLFYKYMDGECKVLALLVYRHPALEDEVLTVDDTDGADTGDAVEDISPEGCLVPGPGLGGLDLCDYLVGVQHVLIVLRSYLHYNRTPGDIVGGQQALGVREAERHCQFLGLAAFRHYVETPLNVASVLPVMMLMRFSLSERIMAAASWAFFSGLFSTTWLWRTATLS